MPTITKEQAKNFKQKSDVESRSKSFWNYITGSAGGWPNKSRAAIIAGIDFTIESGSEEIKFFENNTNLYTAQATDIENELFTYISNYAATQSFDNVVVYGSPASLHPFGENPPMAQRPHISSSFAVNNISCSFNNTTDRQYEDMTGKDEHANTFHLFFDAPSNISDNLKSIASSSFDKRDFKTLLNTSPVSSSLIPTYVSSSKTQGEGIGDWPDYVSKTTSEDASFAVRIGGSIFFNSYRSDLEPSSSMVWNWLNVTGSEGSAATGKPMASEKFIISSGSEVGGKKYLGMGRCATLLTPEENMVLTSFYNPYKIQLIAPAGRLDGWAVWPINPYRGYSSISGSQIRMYDGSQTQIQDIEVGDVVKSYQPIGMPNTDLNYLNYSTDDLAGSFFSGSVVVDIESFDSYHYYTISGSNGNSYHFHQLGSVFAFDSGSDNYRFIPTYDLQVGDKMFDKDGNEVSITSIDENYSGTIKTFYSLDVEDVDTYFTSDILVHNLPGKD